MVDTLSNSKHVMSYKEMLKMSLQIVDYILVTLHPCTGSNCMKEVIEKVLSHPRLGHCLPSYVLHAHFVKMQQEVLLGSNMSIDANKLVQSNMSLVNKNALLIMAIAKVRPHHPTPMW